jgi:hypothetical protein
MKVNEEINPSEAPLSIPISCTIEGFETALSVMSQKYLHEFEDDLWC